MQKISILNQGANEDFMLAISAESMLNSMYLRPTPTSNMISIQFDASQRIGAILKKSYPEAVQEIESQLS